MTEGLAELAELVTRYERPRWDLAAILHIKQLALASDMARTVAACAGRRGGKSYCAAAKGIDVCVSKANQAAVYIAATRSSAKRMVWRAMLDLNREYQLEGVPNLADLTLTFPNGSVFYVLQVDTEKAADLVRGIPNLAWVCVDECQRYKAEILRYLLKDVLRAGQLDALGSAQMWLLGTPNKLGKTGEFWERWSKPETSKHHFTIYDNDRLGTLEQIEAAVDVELKEEGETRESAWYRTEILAEWGVVDLRLRAYEFDDERNTYDVLPSNLTHAVICGDVGWTDEDAVGVLKWADDNPTLYLTKERIAARQTDIDLGEVLADEAAQNDPLVMPLDAGGGGKKTVQTLRVLHPDLPIVEATKPPVSIQVKVLNGVLRLGYLKVPKRSRFSADVRTTAWVNGVVNGKLDEKGRHSNIVPAVRYGVIAAIPFLPQLEELTDDEKAAEKAKAERRARLKKAEKQARAGKPRLTEETEEDWPAPDADDDPWTVEEVE